MIFIKNPEQIKKMRHAGRITGEAILVARDHIRPGVTTKAIDKVIREYIEKCGARPSFLGYGGFPGSACISVNEQVIHGIPSEKVILKEGDIVKIDVGAFIDGFHGDSANTFAVGAISDDAQKLIDATKRSFELALEAAGKEGARIGDVGSAVDSYVTALGYTTVKRYTGHGVGHELHEDPSVPNYGRAGHGPRISVGMVIAIEPMVNAGVEGVRELADGWTVVTADRKLSAHYEHTVAITEDGPECLTKVE
jgi:methionyl aminopeptidase